MKEFLQYVDMFSRLTQYHCVTDSRTDSSPIPPHINIALYTVSQKKGPTLKRYSSKLYGSILVIFGENIQKSLE